MTERESLFPAGRKARHGNYVYVLPYALQSKTFVVHAPGLGSSYYPPACGRRRDFSLVRVANLNLANARPCGACLQRCAMADRPSTTLRSRP